MDIVGSCLAGHWRHHLVLCGAARQDRRCLTQIQTTEFCKQIADGKTENPRKENEMNWDQIEGKWKEMSGSVKSKWGELTDDEVAEVDGDREALEGKIQAKYGKTKAEAKAEVDDFLSRH